LEGFLTELLKFDVKIIEILESEANQESENDKFNRVDLLDKNENGELILVEIQYNDEINYFQRMLYGTAKLITQYMTKGRGYKRVKKVYSVNIVYFELGKRRLKLRLQKIS
jgi:predicted transposase/invertase (TIGR01784 family)